VAHSIGFCVIATSSCRFFNRMNFGEYLTGYIWYCIFKNSRKVLVKAKLIGGTDGISGEDSLNRLHSGIILNV
jgi:hypothetical protein